MIYEFHLTVDPKDIPTNGPLSEWKVTTFHNIGPKSKSFVDSHTLLTMEKDLGSKLEATAWLFDQISRDFKIIKRAKIECGPIKQKYETLYYEAHLRLKEPQGYNSSVAELVSINQKNGKEWHTIRGLDYTELVSTYNEILSSYRNNVEKIEIESVIYDSNPSLDKDWENS
jgi:hypothetical protein